MAHLTLPRALSPGCHTPSKGLSEPPAETQLPARPQHHTATKSVPGGTPPASGALQHRLIYSLSGGTVTAACSEEGFFPAKLWHSSNPLRGSFQNQGCCHPEAQLVELPPPRAQRPAQLPHGAEGKPTVPRQLPLVLQISMRFTTFSCLSSWRILISRRAVIGN